MMEAQDEESKLESAGSKMQVILLAHLVVWVKGLSLSFTNDRLSEYFGFCGRVIFACVDKQEGGLLYFERANAAKTALLMDGAVVDGCRLSVELLYASSPLSSCPKLLQSFAAFLSAPPLPPPPSNYTTSSTNATSTIWTPFAESSSSSSSSTFVPAHYVLSGAETSLDNSPLGARHHKQHPTNPFLEEDDEGKEDEEEKERKEEKGKRGPMVALVRDEAAEEEAEIEYSESVSFDAPNARLIYKAKPILFNFRDVASFVVTGKEKSPLKSGQVYRSACLFRGGNAVDREDAFAAISYLHQHCGIKTIIDLRSSVEKGEDPFDEIAEQLYPTVPVPSSVTASPLASNKPKRSILSSLIGGEYTSGIRTDLNMQYKRYNIDLVNTNLKLKGLFLPSSYSTKLKMLTSAWNSIRNPSSNDLSEELNKTTSAASAAATISPSSTEDIKSSKPSTTGLMKEAISQTFAEEVFNQLGLFGFSKLMLVHSGQEIVRVLRICSIPENHPLMFHCSSGKDRTGIIAMMLLSLCNIPKEQIVEHYHLSERFLRFVADEIRRDNVRKRLSEEFDGTPKYVMWQLFEFVEEKWGSVSGYLAFHGFDLQEQRKLRKLLSTEEHYKRLIRQQRKLQEQEAQRKQQHEQQHIRPTKAASEPVSLHTSPSFYSMTDRPTRLAEIEIKRRQEKEMRRAQNRRKKEGRGEGGGYNSHLLAGDDEDHELSSLKNNDDNFFNTTNQTMNQYPSTPSLAEPEKEKEKEKEEEEPTVSPSYYYPTLNASKPAVEDPFFSEQTPLYHQHPSSSTLPPPIHFPAPQITLSSQPQYYAQPLPPLPSDLPNQQQQLPAVLHPPPMYSPIVPHPTANNNNNNQQPLFNDNAALSSSVQQQQQHQPYRHQQSTPNLGAAVPVSRKSRIKAKLKDHFAFE